MRGILALAGMETVNAVHGGQDQTSPADQVPVEMLDERQRLLSILRAGVETDDHEPDAA